MGYTALYRKFRPTKFSEMVGQEHIKKTLTNQGEQLTRIVEYICDMAKREKIKTEQLWLDSIPENIYVEEIRKKYHVKQEKNIINPIIGEYDAPENQKQDVATINLTNEGNILIYGNAESGKETLLSTICYDLIKNYKTKDVSLYLLDFGSETLKIFNKAPHVGDTVFINDKDKIEKFFIMISQEIRERKETLLKYNGDYNLYLKSNDNIMPMIVIIINNYSAFNENYGIKYEDSISSIARDCVKYRIVFVITADTGSTFKYRLKQNFKKTIVLQLNNDDEYVMVLEKVKKMRPSHLFGRGLIPINDKIYEFQTAKICEPEDYNNFISETIEQLKEDEKIAKPIPILPEIVTFEQLKKDVNAISSIPLGITKKDIKVFNYDFKKNFLTIMTGNDFDEISEFALNIITEIKTLSNVELSIFDAENNFLNEETDIAIQYTNIMDKVANNKKYNLCVIIGIKPFLEKLRAGNIKFYQTLNSLKASKNCSFLIIDSLSKIKNHTFEDWYSNYVQSDSGIWIGNGFKEQFVIKTNSFGKDIINDCGRTLGYVIIKGQPILIKLLEMKLREENNDGYR